MPNIPFKHKNQYIPFKDESKSPYVRLIASIRMIAYLAKSPSPYFEFEDSTFYTDEPNVKIYRIYDSIDSMNLLYEIEKNILDGNLNDTIKSYDFSSINSGNVISFTVHLVNGRKASLKPPFDDFGNQLQNNPIGVPQNFQFVIESTDYQNIVNELLNNSFMSLIEKNIENLINSNLSLYEFLNSSANLYIALIETSHSTYNSFLYLVSQNLSLVNSDTNPDINIININVISNNGNMLFQNNTYSIEYANEITVNCTIENLFKSPINANFVKLQVKLGTDWIDVTQKSIQPETNYFFGSKNEILTTDLLLPDLTPYFTFGQNNNLRLLAQDEQGNVSINEFLVNITYPINVSIYTDPLTDEPDSQVAPTSTVTDADGEVIEAVYDFKNYVYLITDRQKLTNINVQYSLDSVTWKDAEFEIITVSGWDYAKVLISQFGSLCYLRILDENLNATSRIVNYSANWINEENIETTPLTFVIPSVLLDFTGSEIIELTAKIDIS